MDTPLVQTAIRCTPSERPVLKKGNATIEVLLTEEESAYGILPMSKATLMSEINFL